MPTKGSVGTTSMTGRIYRLRALRMLEGRIHGRGNKALAEEFNVSIDTVKRSLDYAQRAGLVTGFEDQILAQLVPLAVDAFKTALEHGDTDVALEVLKGTGLLRKPADKPAAAPGESGDSLEIYIRKIRGSGSDEHFGTKPTVLGNIARLAITAGEATGAIDGVVSEDPAGVSAQPTQGLLTLGHEDYLSHVDAE